MPTDDLGRLVRTLKDKCPLCHNPLQLRARTNSQLVRGVEVVTEKKYISCSVCDYEKSEAKQKGKKHPSVDKAVWMDLDEEVNKERKNANNNKRFPVTKGNGRRG